MIRASIIAGAALLFLQARAETGAAGASFPGGRAASDAAQVRYGAPRTPVDPVDILRRAQDAAPAVMDARRRAPLISEELLLLLSAPLFPPRGAILEDGAHFLPVVTADFAPDRPSKLRHMRYDERGVAVIGNERPWTAPAHRKALPLAA